jgi:hypothetical protein
VEVAPFLAAGLRIRLPWPTPWLADTPSARYIRNIRRKGKKILEDIFSMEDLRVHSTFFFHQEKSFQDLQCAGTSGHGSDGEISGMSGAVFAPDIPEGRGAMGGGGRSNGPFSLGERLGI